MARLVGIVLVLWAAYTSIAFSVENAPGPADSQAATTPATEAAPATAPSAAGSTASIQPDPERETGAAPDALASSRFAGTYAVRGCAERGRPFAEVGNPACCSGESREASACLSAEPSGSSSSGRDRAAEDRAGLRGTISPGLYATGFDAASCNYQLRRLMRDGTERVIGEDQLVAGRLVVTINEIEPDWFTSSPGCGEWAPWQPMAEPLTSVGDGDYWVGDLARGSWSVPSGCRWERVVGFRGALLDDVIDSTSGPDMTEVGPTTLGTRLRGCQLPATLLVPAASGIH